MNNNCTCIKDIILFWSLLLQPTERGNSDGLVGLRNLGNTVSM